MSDLNPPYDRNKVYKVPLKLIFADDEFNCRGVIDPNSVIELARDIKAKGLTQPILIQPWEHDRFKFRIVAGYRRFKAHQINYFQAQSDEEKEQTSTIECLVRPGLTELEARLLNLTENLQREDLSMKQEALAIDPFRRAGWTEDQVARKVNKSRGWVQVRFMLLDLPEEIQDEAAAGMLNQGQIRQIHAIGSPLEQFEFVKKLKDQKILNKKREPKPESVKVKNEKRERRAEEIFEIQDCVRKYCGGNGFHTKLLAWCAGEISDSQVHKAIQEEARKHDNWYVIPYGLEDARVAPQPIEKRVPTNA